jgi:hypothetical protein
VLDELVLLVVVIVDLVILLPLGLTTKNDMTPSPHRRAL